MKLSKYFENGFTGSKNVISDGYDITEVECRQIGKCPVCGTITPYYDIYNSQYVCSTECAKAVVDDYWKHSVGVDYAQVS